MTAPPTIAPRKIWLAAPPGVGAILWVRQLAQSCRLWTEHEPAISMAWRAYGQERSFTEGPLRAPHHTVSLRGMQGSLEHGWRYRPGEMHLAHGGVLLLDEAPEFRHDVLGIVEWVWAEKRLELWSGSARVQVPLVFTLVVRTNLCPCGSKGLDDGACRCTDASIERYFARVGSLTKGAERVELTKADARRLARPALGDPEPT